MYRLSVDMKLPAKKQIEDLQKKSGCPSIKETLIKAFAVLEMVIDHQKAGGKVILENADGTRETLRIV